MHEGEEVMKRIVLTLFTLIVASGCAPKMGEIHSMPKLDSKTAAEISIMRNYNYIGGGIRYYPTVNGKKIAGLYTKHHVQFRLNEGTYTFGIMAPDVLLGRWVKGNSIEKNIAANKQYYFLLSPGLMGSEIEEITQKDGEERISSSNLIQTGTLSENLDPLGKVIMPIGKVIGLDEDDDGYENSSQSSEE